ncbi:hypothetical protein DRE_02181 [Drechslerella stenobrocha 248]|uniref:VPS37 C-terminal domain-containing protein n=1 Tax=Drechslerella stenobrocha 248 TaxID=1043628 RepID=W7I8L0_9PEZI|nr:hypothetical protein DRE_02181 [Drechslerella stenobrocha 248]
MATSPPYYSPPPVPPYHELPTGIPPPPPPKPTSNHASRSGTPYAAPHFLPPLPPAQTAASTTGGQPGNPPPASHAPTTSSSPELFIPSILADKSRDDLLHILHSPALLAALYLSHHPSSPHNLSTLTAALSANLERSWRDKENEMDVALARFSARALHARLGQAVGEADAVSRALEESFLEDDGLDDAEGEYVGPGGGGADMGNRGVKASKDVDNFVKSYRGVRALYHLRKERKERWDENRVGGWR